MGKLGIRNESAKHRLLFEMNWGEFTGRALDACQGVVVKAVLAKKIPKAPESFRGSGPHMACSGGECLCIRD